MCSKNELQIITKSVVEQALALLEDKIEKIILYGSYARGDFTAESDVDIIILLKCDEEEVEQYRVMISRLASRIGLANDIEVSLLLKASSSFEKGKKYFRFTRNIQREGVVLYE